MKYTYIYINKFNGFMMKQHREYMRVLSIFQLSYEQKFGQQSYVLLIRGDNHCPPNWVYKFRIRRLCIDYKIGILFKLVGPWNFVFIQSSLAFGKCVVRASLWVVFYVYYLYIHCMKLFYHIESNKYGKNTKFSNCIYYFKFNREMFGANIHLEI